MPNFSAAVTSGENLSGHDQGTRRRKFCHTRPLWSTLGGFSVVVTRCGQLQMLEVFILGGGVAENWKTKMQEWSGLVHERFIVGHTINVLQMEINRALMCFYTHCPRRSLVLNEL
jgi:hypothetical protein